MRVFIAARGEIAVRVARAARELGWEPVTVYTREDRGSPHVGAGVFSVEVPSYTDGDALVEAALKVGADILHPGYGFLSESPEFAEKVLAAGVSWAGPSPRAMRLLGDKWEAKRLAEKLGVPTLPWCIVSSEGEAVRCAEKLGGRVVLKASRAGGGRGLRVAGSPEEAGRLYRVVVREAELGFGGSGVVYMEKLVERPRHLEVQVLGGRGRLLYLYERECSLQRRRQKIVEEAPSPLAERLRGLREQLLDYAMRLAGAVDYESAGTIEFIVDSRGRPFFIEANTRLQVEHGVTELVTGVDIVKSQLLVAAGRELPYRSEEVKLRGWAIEARVYAEDPWSGFAASEGVVERLRLPEGPWVRVDHALREGVRVSSRYDTMLAKIIVYGFSRSEAVARLDTALSETVIGGVETNLDLLRVIVRSDWFRRGEYDTWTVEERLGELLGEAERLRELARALAGRIGSQAAAAAWSGASTANPGGGGFVGSWHGWPWSSWGLSSGGW